MQKSLLSLAIPTLADKTDVLLFREKFTGHNASGEIPGANSLRFAESYEVWLSQLQLLVNAATVPEGMVQSTSLLAWRVSDGKLVGILQIRHDLNEHLLKVGGHIGYSVAPDERRKGYGTEMLKLGLKHCRILGLKRALVTCDKTNIASAGVIRANGGILENEVDESGNIKQRYWIDLGRSV